MIRCRTALRGLAVRAPFRLRAASARGPLEPCRCQILMYDGGYRQRASGPQEEELQYEG